MEPASSMLFGYARVSTQDQNLDLQLDDLKTVRSSIVERSSIWGDLILAVYHTSE